MSGVYKTLIVMVGDRKISSVSRLHKHAHSGPWIMHRTWLRRTYILLQTTCQLNCMIRTGFRPESDMTDLGSALPRSQQDGFFGTGRLHPRRRQAGSTACWSPPWRDTRQVGTANSQQQIIRGGGNCRLERWTGEDPRMPRRDQFVSLFGHA
jgi:hypothetical protein